jgi:hypothetical protein
MQEPFLFNTVAEQGADGKREERTEFAPLWKN